MAAVTATVIAWTVAGLMLGPVGLRYRMTFGVLVAIGAALVVREQATGLQERTAAAGAIVAG
jgi:hypothetical protein